MRRPNGVRFTEHAAKRMAQRQVGRADILAAIANPIKTAPAEHGCVSLFGHTQDARKMRFRITYNPTLRVVVTIAIADRRFK